MASIYLRGKTYWISWWDNGSHHRESLKTRDKKEAALLCKAKELSLGGHDVTAHNPTVFRNFCKSYLEWHKNTLPDSHQRVAQITKDYLIPSFGGLKLDEITPLHVETWRANRRGVTNGTINKELRTLKAIMHKALEWEVMSRDRLVGVKDLQELDSKPKNFFTVQQLTAIYGADCEYSPVWKLLANTGMRRAEAVNLRWDNVFEDKIHVLSMTGRRTKSKKWRAIPVSPGCATALSSLNRESVYVLPRDHKDSLSRRFRKVLKRLGYSGTLHDLRHTFISHLVMQGVPLRTVQVLAGHSRIETTEGYAHLSPDYMADAVSGLEL